MKADKIIYWTATGLLSLMALAGAGMYFFEYSRTAENFGRLGFPGYLVYPLAIAKILGVIAIWSKQSEILKEWAYAGFFFVFLLAISAHLVSGYGSFVPPFVALGFLFVSFAFDKKIYG